MSVDTSNATATAGVDPSRARIAGAIKQAANTTGTSFEYLLATAKMESDFNPTAGASTSSAHGLYQFIDQTWLGTVKEAGAQLGYGNYADAITKSSSGSYSVSDPAARRAIMKLRDDPAAASAMAAVLTQSNSFKLTGMIGRRPTDSELYMAHFMGVGGAAKLISNAEDNPQASGARLFPNAAAANRSIFYRSHRAGAQRLRSLFGADRNAMPAPPVRRRRARALAMYGDVVQPAPRSPAPRRRGGDRQRRLSLDIPGCRRGRAGDDGLRIDDGQRLVVDAMPVFRSLFQAGDRVAAGLADGSRIVGQFLVADLGRKRRSAPRQHRRKRRARRSRLISSATAAERSAARRLRLRSGQATRRPCRSP